MQFHAGPVQASTVSGKSYVLMMSRGSWFLDVLHLLWLLLCFILRTMTWQVGFDEDVLFGSQYSKVSHSLHSIWPSLCIRFHLFQDAAFLMRAEEGIGL